MNPWHGLKDLPKNMWTIFFATLINRTGTMVLPFLTIYLTTRRGESIDQAGLVIAVYGLGALLTGPFAGKLSDKIGAKELMKISLIVSGLVLFIYSLVVNFQLILLITFFWSIINESFRPANLSLISHVVPSNQRRTAFALNRLAINLGMSIGPVAAGFLILINFSITFYVDGITSILAGLFLTFAPWREKTIVPITPNEKTEADKLPVENNTISILKDKRMFYFILTLIPVSMVYFQHMSTLPLYLVKELGFKTSIFGMLIAINTVLIILVEVPLNNSLTKWRDSRLLTIGAILAAIGFGSMVFAKDILFIAATIVIWTFGEMILFPASANYISSIAPESRRGEYMGFFQITFSLAFTVGPWLGTVVFEHLGSAALWIGTFIFAGISASMMYAIKDQPCLPDRQAQIE
jgi:MFS family permease